MVIQGNEVSDYGLELNFAENLIENQTPGSGIVLGRSKDGIHAIQVYWEMDDSSSEGSYLYESDYESGNNEISVTLTRKRVAEDSYQVMREFEVFDKAGKIRTLGFVAANSDLVNEIPSNALSRNFSVIRAFQTSVLIREYDMSNDSTPEIAGMIAIRSISSPSLVYYRTAIVRPNQYTGTPEQLIGRGLITDLPSGVGICFHTYEDPEGNPFTQDPYTVALQESLEGIANQFFENLDPGARVGIVVKSINLKSGSSEVYVLNNNERKKETTKS